MYKNSGNSIPLLGSEINEESKLFKFIFNFENFIYLGLDFDAKDKQVKIAEKLLSNQIQPWLINISKENKDLGSLTKKEVKALKDNAIFIADMDELLKYRINK